MVKKVGPKTKDVVHSVSFCCGLLTLENSVKLEVVRRIVHGEGFRVLVCAEHSDELLVRFLDFFLVIGRRLEHARFFLCWLERVAREGTKVV